ncbi:DUF2637 domain-containing protein [Streptomyces sp. NPDC054933]
MTRAHRILIGVVVLGVLAIAAIGFAGSYAAVRELALRKGFGWFANVFPIGIDAGIVVLLALDLLLTWFRIPFPLLRQSAWLLTAATIAFNGAAAWPDPLGVGMHAVIPVLFVVSVEAARHAIGRIADITADRHMESVRIARWLLALPSTFRLWRRMKLWELRSYDEVIRLEQDRLVYRARLRAKYGRAWRRKAPVESLMPLRLARYGVPMADTAPDGLAAAGIAVPANEVHPAIPSPAAEPVEDTVDSDEATFNTYRAYVSHHGEFPKAAQAEQLAAHQPAEAGATPAGHLVMADGQDQAATVVRETGVADGRTADVTAWPDEGAPPITDPPESAVRQSASVVAAHGRTAAVAAVIPSQGNGPQDDVRDEQAPPVSEPDDPRVGQAARMLQAEPRISGSEVARRLGVAERTGRRIRERALEYLRQVEGARASAGRR